MPRYFFHTEDEDGRSDDVAGVEFANDKTAKLEAVHAFGEMLLDAEDGSCPASYAMQVVRADGENVCRLSLRLGDPKG